MLKDIWQVHCIYTKKKSKLCMTLACNLKSWSWTHTGYLNLQVSFLANTFHIRAHGWGQRIRWIQRLSFPIIAVWELLRQARSTLIQSWISLISLGKGSHVKNQIRKLLSPLDKRVQHYLQKEHTEILQKVKVSDQYYFILVSPIIMTLQRA